MRHFLVRSASHIKGKVSLPGDKSIAHRALIISAISSGKTSIDNFPANDDVLSTAKILKSCAIKIEFRKSKPKRIIVFGRGLRGLKKPRRPVFVGDSGTTIRLMAGIFSGQTFKVKLVTGKSLAKRPMLRITAVLRKMGSIISACTTVKPHTQYSIRNTQYEEYPPLTIQGGNLKAIKYKLPIASAQVKSAILLAGLYAKGATKVVEPLATRDHTERMLKLFKADIKVIGNTIVIKGGRNLISPHKISIPGDISSASFFMVLTTILPDSCILLKNISLNRTRIGILRVLKRMGADIKVTLPVRQAGRSPGHPACPAGRQVTRFEPAGDVLVRSSRLNGTVIAKQEVPSLIDELPILMVAASFAEGRSVFNGVEELRRKETDRIKSMVENLSKLGANIEVLNELKSQKIIIQGKKELVGSPVKSFGDHRTAMSMVVAGLRANGSTLIDDIACINKSFPDFLKILRGLLK